MVEAGEAAGTMGGGGVECVCDAWRMREVLSERNEGWEWSERRGVGAGPGRYERKSIETRRVLAERDMAAAREKDELSSVADQQTMILLTSSPSSSRTTMAARQEGKHQLQDALFCSGRES